MTQTSTPSDIKTLLYQHCENYVQELIHRAQQGIQTAQKSANTEQKSSAGDKFETHRAMMHLQMESFINRLHIAQDLEVEINRITLQKVYQKVELGALVHTDQGWFFIAVSAPAYHVEQEKYVCVSTQAPFYQAMQGCTVGDWVDWFDAQGQEDVIEILEIY